MAGSSLLPPDLQLLGSRAAQGLGLGSLLSAVAGDAGALQEALPYWQRVLLWLFCVAATGLLLHRQNRRAPGWQRAGLALSAAALNSVLPLLLFDRATELNAVVTSFIATTALSSYKVRGTPRPTRGQEVAGGAIPQLLQGCMRC